MGLTQGFLLRGINLHATELSTYEQSLLLEMFMAHNFLRSSTIALRRSDVVIMIKLSSFVFHLHVVLMVRTLLLLLCLFFHQSLSMSSYTIGCNFCIGLVVLLAGMLLLRQDVSSLITEVFPLSDVSPTHIVS